MSRAAVRPGDRGRAARAAGHVVAGRAGPDGGRRDPRRRVPHPPDHAHHHLRGRRGSESYIANYFATTLADQDFKILIANSRSMGSTGASAPSCYVRKACRTACTTHAATARSPRWSRTCRKTCRRKRAIDYLIVDSVMPACDGKPEDAEVAQRYFQALRRIGRGSLNIAHITKAGADTDKPFGSAFWHNLSRATWFAKLAETSLDGRTLTLALHDKKHNTRGKLPAIGFEVTFGEGQTTFRRANLADVAEHAADLPLAGAVFWNPCGTSLGPSSSCPSSWTPSRIPSRRPSTVARTRASSASTRVQTGFTDGAYSNGECHEGRLFQDTKGHVPTCILGTKGQDSLSLYREACPLSQPHRSTTA